MYRYPINYANQNKLSTIPPVTIPKNKYRDDKRNVILTIFAGRKYYLEILFKYLDILINHDKLHEVHLWNYTRSETDNVWLKSLNKNKYIIYEPKNKNGWQW